MNIQAEGVAILAMYVLDGITRSRALPSSEQFLLLLHRYTGTFETTEKVTLLSRLSSGYGPIWSVNHQAKSLKINSSLSQYTLIEPLFGHLI